MDSIKKDVILVIVFAVSLVAIITIMSIIVLGCENDPTPIKTSISLMSNYIGAIATFTAAFIAAMLFNDWKKEHNKNVENNFALDVINKFDLIDQSLVKFRDSFKKIKMKMDGTTSISDDEFINLKNEISILIMNMDDFHFGIWLESLRKYDLIKARDHNYYNLAKHCVINAISYISKIRSVDTTILNDVREIDSYLSKISQCVLDLEAGMIDKIIKDLKAK